VLHQNQEGQLSWVGNFPMSLQDVQAKRVSVDEGINTPTKALSLSAYPYGYAKPILPPTMIGLALPEKAPEMVLKDVSSILDMELDFAAHLDSEEMEMDSNLDSPQDDADGGTSGGSGHEVDKSQVMLC
jgi:hypothetical protein